MCFIDVIRYSCICEVHMNPSLNEDPTIQGFECRGAIKVPLMKVQQYKALNAGVQSKCP